MLTRSKFALSLAIMLGTASAAMAATKHPVHRHHVTVQRQVPAAALQSFGFARGQGLGQEPTYMYIQDDDFRRSSGGI